MNFIKIVFTLISTLCYGFNIYAAEKNNLINHPSGSKTSRATRSREVIPCVPLATTIQKLESYDDDFDDTEEKEAKKDMEKNSSQTQSIHQKYIYSKSAEDLAAVALTDPRVTRYSSKKTHKEEK